MGKSTAGNGSRKDRAAGGYARCDRLRRSEGNRALLRVAVLLTAARDAAGRFLREHPRRCGCEWCRDDRSLSASIRASVAFTAAALRRLRDDLQNEVIPPDDPAAAEAEVVRSLYGDAPGPAADGPAVVVTARGG